MTTAQLTQIAAAAAAFLAIVALIGLAIVLGRLRRLQRQQHVILGSLGERDIVRHVVSLDEKVGHLRTAVEDLGLTSRDHDNRIDTCLSRMGVVRFDAYDDLGGRQSTAIALMDAKEDGVVLTTVISRDFARMYVKLLRDGQPDIPLAPEETEAVDQARSRAPFTVRPRMDEAKRAEEQPEPVSAEAALAEEQDAARALNRENRRREREGLAPLTELPPPPSSQGWQALEIPTDATASGDGEPIEQSDAAEESGAGDGPTPGRAAPDASTGPGDAVSGDADAAALPGDERLADDAGREPAKDPDLWFDDVEDPVWPSREDRS